MSSPLVSVLMTAYKREKYIAEAIESVLASTFNDFELIIVDDASTDHTVEIARQYCSDPRVQVHANEKNLGDYNNRNRAASLATGKYLKYLDSDDVIYPHGLAVMVESMEKFPQAALGLVQPQMKERPYPIQVSPEQAYRENFLAGGLLDYGGPTGAILRFGAYQQVGGFSGKRYVGDTDLWLNLAARHPVVKLMEGLVWWRTHGEQEIAYERNSLMAIGQRFLVSMQSLKSPHCPLNALERRKAIHWLNYRHSRNILHIALRKHSPSVAFNIMRETQFASFDLLRAFSAGCRTAD